MSMSLGTTLPEWLNDVPDDRREPVKESFLECRRNSLPDVDALLSAGWRYELPEIVNHKEGEPSHMETEPWQWYWRSPPKRKGSKGRRYLSTTQAFNALKRLSSLPTTRQD